MCQQETKHVMLKGTPQGDLQTSVPFQPDMCCGCDKTEKV